MIQIRVPATSANLGPGFDCLGLALDLDLVVHLTLSERDSFCYRGEGSVAENPTNLIHTGFRAAYDEVGEVPPAVTFEAENPIPLARGLGSSSAALVAGIAAADHLLKGALGREGVFQLAAGLEGHPDNVAPAVFGGFTVSTPRATGGFVNRHLPLPSDWRLLFGIPTFELPTPVARRVLPGSYSRDDAVLTAGRVALWTLAVAEANPELLRSASLDVLHEPYRARLVPGFIRTKQRLYRRGAFAAYLSGAGPTAGVICDAKAIKACTLVLQEFAGPDGCVLELESGRGYSVEPQVTFAPGRP